jgi:hypothetical protein
MDGAGGRAWIRRRFALVAVLPPGGACGLGFDHDPLGVLPHKSVRRSCMGLRSGIGSSITAILDQTFTKCFDSTTGF